MANSQSIAFSATSQHRKTPKYCPTCGEAIPSHKHMYCGPQCKPSTYVKKTEPRTHCAQCGGDMPDGRSAQAVYCSDKCKRQARAPKVTNDSKLKWRLNAKRRHLELVKQGATKACNECGEEKAISEFYASASICKKCTISKVSKTRQEISEDQRERYLENKKAWKKANPEANAAHARTSRLKNGDLKYQQHVRDWRRFKRGPLKHDAHVKAWRLYVSEAKTRESAGWWARKLKAEGRPWKNPHFSDAMQYKIQYRMDLEFRLKEINRQTWRKKILKAREDGTVNFWVLLRERKTCPYCGTKITKENAVGDHMIPIKLGGANSNHNMTICCRTCNQRKSGH
ncbi:MAG: HNH endonuclease, partial [Gammaproteobacteria bacterium]|nr:HNH endonuclease [Gammaproteobacteria bacterium]